MHCEQQGVSLPPRFDHPGMQYHHGGSRSRMPPFARGGAYSRGHKQFYPPPQLPAAAPPPPPPQHKYEVLMEAGRLAAEYLVAKGMLPPASLQRRGVGVGSVGWGQLPPTPPLPPGQEAPAFYDARNGRNGRRRFDDEYSNLNPRSRQNRGGDYNSSNSSNHNGRGKRKFGAYNRFSDWGRDTERSRGYPDCRSYDDDDEDEDEDGAPGYRRELRSSRGVDEDGAPGYRRELRSSRGVDEVGSSVWGVAGEGPSSKAEAMGESELEDTGSNVSSNGNVRKDADALQEMQEDNKVSNSEVVEQGMNGGSNNASSGVVEEAETKHAPVPSDDKVSDEKPDDSSVLNEKVEDDKTLDEKAEDDKALDEKVSSVDNSLRDDCKKLLSYCSFTRVSTRPRSMLAHRNGAPAPAHREIAIAEQVDLVSSEEVPQMAIDEAANDSSLTNAQAGNKDDRVCLEHTDPSTACHQMVEQVRFQEKETQIETEDTREQNNIAKHYAIQETKEHSGLSPTLAHQNSLKLQVVEGIPIYNIDTPPQDEDLIDSADKGKAVGVELSPNTGAETSATMEEEKLGQSSSFKICDLNLVGSPEVAEIRNDPGLGQRSTAGCSLEAQNQQQIDFGTTVGNNASNTDGYAQIPLDNKAVQVIDIEDDSPIEASACDTSKAKSKMIYSSMENIMNPTVNTDVLPGIQDGYNLVISDYLGADMSCYQSIQTDLHAEMALNDSEGITVMDDQIYGSLSDIGFMDVWDQPPQDYEKFF